MGSGRHRMEQRQIVKRQPMADFFVDGGSAGVHYCLCNIRVCNRVSPVMDVFGIISAGLLNCLHVSGVRDIPGA
jgi:hypothetical protein